MYHTRRDTDRRLAMKVTLKVCRAAKIRMEHIRAAAGVDPMDSGQKALQAIHERYGPMAPTFKLIPPPTIDGDAQPDDDYPYAIALMEVMRFDEMTEPGLPRCGVVEHEPLNAAEVHRVDGALESELGRIGIPVDAEYFQWRSYYEIRGS